MRKLRLSKSDFLRAGSLLGFVLCLTACADEAAPPSATEIRHAERMQAIEGRQPLTIELPLPAMIPTPPEKPRGTTAIEGEEPPTLLAPPGAVNLALGNPVIASDDDPLLGEPNYITDGIKFGSDADMIELMPERQWVQIDLQRPASIHAIVIWREDSGAMAGQHVVYRDVVVQIADDAAFTENVRTVFNNDQDNSSGLGAGTDREYFETHDGKRIQLNGEVARYLRFYSNGNTRDNFNRYLEIEVYGVPAP